VTPFAREWNAAPALVLLAAAILFARGHELGAAGVIAFALLVVIARGSATRRQNRGFHGQDNGAR
jgi:hypothetical protein